MTRNIEKVIPLDPPKQTTKVPSAGRKWNMTGLPDYTLDHIGMLFHDLDHAEGLYNRLGFKLTPRAVLKKEDDFGRTTPGGLSNQHVMLKTGYLELAAVTHPEAGNPLADRVAEYQGVHIIVFGSSSADEARARIQSSGFQIQEPAVAQRTLYFIDPPGKAKFKWFPIPWWEPSEGLLAMVEHLTPEALRTSEIIDHPNGAMELDQVFICAPNVEESGRRFECLLNITPQAENGAVFFECREGRLVIMDPSLLEAAFPGATIPRLPCIAGYSINVRDAGQTRRLIQDNGFQVHNLPGNGFWVSGDSTMGAIIRFQ